MYKINKEIATKEGTENPQQRALFNLLVTQAWAQGKLRNMLSEFDITYQQENILAILYENHPEPLTSTDIKERLIEKNADLTRLCDRLESKGLITRQSNPKNRRQIFIAITPSGQELLHKVEPTLQEALEKISGLSEDESAQLSALLDKFRKEEGIN